MRAWSRARRSAKRSSAAPCPDGCWPPQTEMRKHEAFLAYTPYGVGLRAAIMYLKTERDVYGWFTGPQDGQSVSAYFLLDAFYTVSGPRFYATEGTDLYAGWTYDYAARPAKRLAARQLLDDALCHELDRAQSAFATEWLFYRDAPGAEGDMQAYAEAELALGETNIRYHRLARLSHTHVTWTYYSPRFEHAVLTFLSRHWPLDYRED